MADVLADIVARKRTDTAGRLDAIDASAAQPSTRSLTQALSRAGARFIMEVKQASPSGHRARHDLATAVAAYAPVTDAISVLTDTPYFGGSLDDLRVVRARFDGPILAKDFVIDPRQVIEARLHGADAVLAMLSVLDDDTARAVMAEADRLAMDVLVEVHDDAELDRALALGAALIGINNRDLKTLRTDLAVTERLAARVPASVTLISESGVGSRADTARLEGRVDGFLVGSSLMASDDIALAARALVFGHVKVCGLIHIDDVTSAAAAGATHAGMIFVDGTPRAISANQARPLSAAARDTGVKSAGVFRDASADAVLRIADAVGLDVIQLHGREGRDLIAELQHRFAGEIWTVCAPDEDRGGDRPLFDHGAGGTGVPFDWTKIAGHPRLPVAMLAGGIDATNARAAQHTGVYGIDASSRLEGSPGRKDPGKVQGLFDSLRLHDRKTAR